MVVIVLYLGLSYGNILRGLLFSGFMIFSLVREGKEKINIHAVSLLVCCDKL